MFFKLVRLKVCWFFLLNHKINAGKRSAKSVDDANIGPAKRTRSQGFSLSGTDNVTAGTSSAMGGGSSSTVVTASQPQPHVDDFDLSQGGLQTPDVNITGGETNSIDGFSASNGPPSGTGVQDPVPG